MLASKFYYYLDLLKNFAQKIDDIQTAVGRIENRQLLSDRCGQPSKLSNYEYKVTSQWGEDGIIQFLINAIEIPNRIFIEFGVENYTESNTRFLLQNNNWSGLVIDGSEENIRYIKNDPVYWRYNLKAECAFIESENIDRIIETNGITADIGLLSIDLDGNDYWVWKAIQCVSPRVVICEYNSVFGPYAKVTIPYERNFRRALVHYSGLYYGASIAALTDLALLKGYSLVGSNSAGNNVFFVRNDLVADLTTYTAAEAYVKSQFRESRNTKGELTFLDFHQRFELIQDMEVYDLELGRNMKIRNIEV